MKPVYGIALAVAVLATAACDDEDPTDVIEPTTFEVRIENVSEVYDFLSSGVFNTPVGADAPGPLTPGNSYQITFTAGPGDRLHFATMFVQSNDFFYAPDGDGIMLYDGDTPVEGDVTDQVDLWDAGTEINQEPGLGEDQAPNQSGPDTGADDPDNTVRLAPDDFNNLPAVSDVVQVTLTHLGGGQFRLVIRNVSDANTLQTSDNGSGPVVLAPGVVAVGPGTDALFTVGEPDRGEGLEPLAEDGNAGVLGQTLAESTGLTSPLAPGAWAVHRDPSVLFAAGEPDRGDGLEALAEDGVPTGLASALEARDDVLSSGIFNTPEGAGSPGPLLPGNAYTFTVTAEPGDRLSFATMLVRTNDLFYAPAEAGIALFTAGGAPMSGEATGMLLLWDAGTEVNEAPGAGRNQAPTQAGPDTGPDENGVVMQVNDGYTYPPTSDVVRLTITPTN